MTIIIIIIIISIIIIIIIIIIVIIIIIISSSSSSIIFTIYLFIYLICDHKSNLLYLMYFRAKMMFFSYLNFQILRYCASFGFDEASQQEPHTQDHRSHVGHTHHRGVTLRLLPQLPLRHLQRLWRHLAADLQRPL